MTDGDPKAHARRVDYWRGEKRLAVVTVNRASLLAEVEMETAY